MMMLAIPSAVGLMVLATPIVALIFERGAFTAQSTALVAGALVAAKFDDYLAGKRELQAQVVSIALGAGSNLLALFKGPGSKLASQIQALIEKREKETA